MIPAPVSPTSLEAFVTCPKQYHEVKVLKRFKEDESEQLIWGQYVHKSFELRQAFDDIGGYAELPPDLVEHEQFMQLLQGKPGKHWTEQRRALNDQLQPCGFFDKACRFRCVIDWRQVHGDYACIVDYKTGKQHSKFNQLKLNAIHTFAEFSEVNLVNCQYYWTQSKLVTKQVYARDQLPELWAVFTPDLKQYVEAYKNDVWQPRPSGLCHGWCPVTDCAHWRPKRKE